MLGQTVTSSLTLLLFVAYLVYALYIFYFYLSNYLMLFSPPRRCSKSERYESDKQKKKQRGNQKPLCAYKDTTTPHTFEPVYSLFRARNLLNLKDMKAAQTKISGNKVNRSYKNTQTYTHIRGRELSRLVYVRGGRSW